MKIKAAMGKFPRGTIMSRSGRPFNFLDRRTWQFDLIDTVHALSQINRFVGHSDRPYSVLQHLLWCQENVQGLVPDDVKSVVRANWIPRLRLEAMTHDFAESELGDVSSPLKALPAMDFYTLLEDKVLEAKQRAFGVWFDDWDSGRQLLIDTVDRLAFLTEVRDLRGEDDYDFLPRSTIHPLPPDRVRGLFMAKFMELKEQA